MTDVLTTLHGTNNVARSLEAKRVVEYFESPAPRLRIRGALLWEHLRRQVGSLRSISPMGPKRVGVYVDFENVRSYRPLALSYGEFARRVSEYASRFGEVAARWVAVSSWNVREEWPRVKSELLEAGFLVIQEPRGFSATRAEEKRDVADFVLMAQAVDEVAELRLSSVVIATGDGDLLVLVSRLMEKGIPVRLIRGADESTSKDYYRLAQSQAIQAQALGLTPDEALFAVVALEDVLSIPAS